MTASMGEQQLMAAHTYLAWALGELRAYQDTYLPQQSAIEKARFRRERGMLESAEAELQKLIEENPTH